jgi:hypothetical protein
MGAETNRAKVEQSCVKGLDKRKYGHTFVLESVDLVARHAQKDKGALCSMRVARRESEAERAMLVVAAGTGLRSEAPARKAERVLILDPLFMPSAQRCDRMIVESTISARQSSSTGSRSASVSASKSLV